MLKEALPVMTKSKLTRDSLLDYILTWHPAWMDNEQHDELSVNLPHSPEIVKRKYSSSDEYLNTMWPLILIEFFSQVSIINLKSFLKYMIICIIQCPENVMFPWL